MHWRIRHIRIDSGFLAGLDVELPPGLTCVIGARGSGKTTLAETLRFALNGLTGAPRARTDLIRTNLGAGAIRIHVETEARRYTLARSLSGDPVVDDESGAPVHGVDLDKGTFLPLDAFTSTEIEAIADEVLGDRRRVLLDQIRQTDVRDWTYRQSELRRKLDANADAIRRLARERDETMVRIEERRNAPDQFAAMTIDINDEDTKELARSVEQQRWNQQEQEALKRQTQQVASLQEGVSDFLKKMRVLAEGGAPQPSSLNSPLYNDGFTRVAAAAQESIKHFEASASAIQEGRTALIALQERIATAHEEQRTVHAKIQHRQAERSQLLQQRSAAEIAVQELERDRARVREIDQEMAALAQLRQTLRADYLQASDGLSSLREAVADELQASVGPLVRVRVRRQADVSRYQELLTTGLKGSRTKNHEDIVAQLITLRPDQLAQILRDGGAEEIDQTFAFGAERSRRVWEALRGSMDPMELELVLAEDRVGIELDVGRGDGKGFRDAAELSRGQKCTALLPMLLVRRQVPLIIDQPEDNLDNRFIYETIVETIRRVKTRRQLIFVTHNANIPVLAEAELVIVMGSDGKKGIVQQQGNIEACKGAIVDLLEGGREAFEKRRERYGVEQ